MRSHLIVLFGLLYLNTLSAQPPTQKPVPKKTSSTQRPSSAEMNAQMQEASARLRKQIAEMEKQIATAKAENESPESIQQKESMLASAKKMLASIEKIDPSGPPKVNMPQYKTELPEKYKSQLLPVKLKQPVAYPTKEQAKDTLFSFVGKKSDDTTLLTPERSAIRYSRRRNVVIIQENPNPDTPLHVLLARGLAQIQRIRKDFVVSVDAIQNSFFMFPQIQAAYDEFNLQADKLYSHAKNTIGLVENLYTQVDFEAWERELLDMQRDLNRKIASLTPIDRPTIEKKLPPERPTDLCYCDASKAKDFESKLDSWSHDFYRDENTIWNFIMDMLTKMEDYIDNGFGRRIPQWNATIFAAKRELVKRMSDKLFILTEKYEDDKNIFREEGLALTAINLGNKIGLLQKISPEDASTRAQAEQRFQRVKDILVRDKYFKEYIEEQKGKHNYMVIFDYGLYTSHEISKASVTGFLGDINPLVLNWIKRLDDYNRFTLKFDLQFLLHDQGLDGRLFMTADGTLESDEVEVSLGQLGCKWQLYLKNADHGDKNADEEIFEIPLRVIKGEKDFIDDKKPPMPYAGPEYFKMVFPSIRISFCETIPDSVIMGVLRYDDASLQAFGLPNYTETYTTDMLPFVNKLILGILKTKQNMSEMMNVAADMISLANTNQVPYVTQVAALDHLAANYFGNLTKHELQARASQATHSEGTVITFEAINEEPLLIAKDQAANTNDEDAQIGRKLAGGKITIKSKHKCAEVGCTTN